MEALWTILYNKKTHTNYENTYLIYMQHKRIWKYMICMISINKCWTCPLLQLKIKITWNLLLFNENSFLVVFYIIGLKKIYNYEITLLLPVTVFFIIVYIIRIRVMVFKCHFQQYFSYIVVVSFIGGGNRSTRRKPPTRSKTLTSFIS